MATKEGETSVLWDMNSCPVSSIFDAGQVGPSIKWPLKNLGYSGRVTVTAIGILNRVPTDVLQAVYSSGVSLIHVRTECLDIDVEMTGWLFGHQQRPSNFTLISCEKSFLMSLANLEMSRHNVIRQFSCVQQVVVSTLLPFPVWESFLAILRGDAIDDSGVLDKDPGWRCTLCCFVTEQGFESFTSHFYDPIHVIRDNPRMRKKRKQPEEEEDDARSGES